MGAGTVGLLSLALVSTGAATLLGVAVVRRNGAPEASGNIAQLTEKVVPETKTAQLSLPIAPVMTGQFGSCFPSKACGDAFAGRVLKEINRAKIAGVAVCGLAYRLAQQSKLAHPYLRAGALVAAATACGIPVLRASDDPCAPTRAACSGGGNGGEGVPPTSSTEQCDRLPICEALVTPPALEGRFSAVVASVHTIRCNRPVTRIQMNATQYSFPDAKIATGSGLLANQDFVEPVSGTSLAELSRTVTSVGMVGMEMFVEARTAGSVTYRTTCPRTFNVGGILKRVTGDREETITVPRAISPRSLIDVPFP